VNPLSPRGVFRGGGQNPHFCKNFINLLGFFEKKNPVDTKKQTPSPRKISGYAPD